MKFTATSNRICSLCGQEFTPRSRNQKYCDNIHTRPCPICGKAVPFKFPSERLKCCSKECAQEMKRRTFISKYGVDNPAKSEIIKNRQADTCLERYGVSTPFLMKDFNDKRNKTCIEKYGMTNPMLSKEVQSRIKNTTNYNWGVDSPLQIPHVRDALMEIYSDQNKLRDVVSKRVKTGNIVASDGTHLDSQYELDVYEYSLRNNIKIDRQVPIEYEYEGRVHRTFIDFRLDGILFECKGYHLMVGCFDNAPNMIPISAKLDVYRKNDVVVITDELSRGIFGHPSSSESNGLKYKDRCSNPLIGVDINLFRDPVFPYRDDRPKCFYDVKVDGQISSHDAFFDEKIRWKMILNRIQYSGGFIDSGQILNALNVTRTCKQPSWFSKSLAKDIIRKYCSSDVIVDPFAGWGARADAANDLHRFYIGCDFNKELVEWHHSRGRTNISFYDANQFKYDGECSVFICPPYSDPKSGRCFEDYNFEGFDDSAKSKSQCDWLKIVMSNIPNAREYVMVCKVVDNGWEKYIVDTKKNKSHFGSNDEYILVVNNTI